MIESWEDACPLEGTCTECGLVFEWADLLSFKIRKPRWNVEYATSALGYAIRAVATLGMSFVPGRFFSSLKMTHEYRPRRIVLYLLWPLLLAYVLFAALQGLAMRAHLAGYGGSPTSTISVSTARAVTHAVLLPLSKKPPGTITIAAGRNARWYRNNPRFVRGNAAPNTVTMALDSPFELASGRSSRGYDSAFWEVWPEVLLGTRGVWRPGWKHFVCCLILLVVFCLLCPVGYLLLPQSRRQARVRPEHIVRITLYSLVFVVLLAVVIGLAQGTAYRHIDAESLFLATRVLSLIVIPAWLIVWWSRATDRYLKIPHGWGVGLSLGLIAYLLGPVLVYCVVIFFASLM